VPEPGAAVTARVSTGIQIIDDRLGGGFRRPSTLLFFSEIPSEKRLFAEHFVVTGMRAGETCLYVDFFRAPQLARREFAAFGSFPAERLVFVDATSTQLLLPTEEKYKITNIDDLDHIVRVIKDALRQSRPARVVIDSMEFLADRFDRKLVMRYWRELIETAHEVGSAVCFMFINWTYGEAEVQEIQSMCDFIVEFQTTMRGGILRNTLRIMETREGGLRTSWVPYTFHELVGLTVYFPRILVTGPFSAGKSTVVKALSKTSVSVDRLGTTVAFDYGNVDLLGLEAELLGTPGQERFEFIFRIFAREVSGLLLVIDATRPEELPRARQMLDLVGEHVPYVILANKSDLPGAMQEHEIRRGMKLPGSAAVVFTVATEGTGVRDALKILAEMIVGVR